MRPTLLLVGLIIAYALLGIPLFWNSGWWTVWLAMGGVLQILSLHDLSTARRERGQLNGNRFINSALPVGVWTQVSLKLHNLTNRSLRIELVDHTPTASQQRLLPHSDNIAALEKLELNYRLRPGQRGDLQLGKLQVLVDSPLRLWQINHWLATPQTVRVYPNFALVSQYSLLAGDNQLGQLGIRQKQRRGEGQEFHQLRDYREGDSLRQIDWKATSRLQRPIAREYQDERDQQVIFLLDCGRRMRAQDGELSHFDHCLNAMLLLAHVALRQGDAVGVQTFGNKESEERALPLQKGGGVLNLLLENLYDLQPSLTAADFTAAAEQVITRFRKRALVVIITNARDEDSAELQAALRLLQKRHLVMLANLREQALDDAIAAPMDSFDQALLAASTWHYLQQREHAQQQLEGSGAEVLNVTPVELPIAMVNRYLSIKRSGRL